MARVRESDLFVEDTAGRAPPRYPILTSALPKVNLFVVAAQKILSNSVIDTDTAKKLVDEEIANEEGIEQEVSLRFAGVNGYFNTSAEIRHEDAAY